MEDCAGLMVRNQWNVSSLGGSRGPVRPPDDAGSPVRRADATRACRFILANMPGTDPGRASYHHHAPIEWLDRNHCLLTVAHICRTGEPILH